MSDYKSVTLTELEYHKLMRYSDQEIAVQAQAENLVTQLKVKIAEAKQIRDDYFEKLTHIYPELSKTVAYTPSETDFTLNPNITEG